MPSRSPRRSLSIPNVVAAVAGFYHMVALRNDGTVLTSSLSRSTTGGTSRKGEPTSGGFVAIACSNCHSVALRDDGTVVTWGDATV
ncbi:MAG: RCC1 repeat-containing protein, partial [Myxococcota bacterium]